MRTIRWSRSLGLLSWLAIAACSTEAVPEASSLIEVPVTPADAPAMDATLQPIESIEPIAPTTVVTGPVTTLPPNEVGRFLVLEYHRLGEPEGEFSRSAQNFRHDLRILYESGYRPVTMRDVLDGRIDIPAGTTPVVFTIDDSSRGQFYFREDGSIDPESMVGMWESFRNENPAWNSGAVWCILPAADHPSNFFGEKPSREVPRAEREETIRRKMEHLVTHDHEICNHTLYHARLDRARDDAQVQEFIGRGEDSIQVYLPEGYDIVTFALPLGMWPKTRSLAWQGSHAGRAYSYRAVLEVSGDANESPFDSRFDPHSVNRFIVAPGRLERQLAAWERDPTNRYVSDGDPTTIAVPAAMQEFVARERWPGKRIHVVDASSGDDSPTR